MATQPRNSKKLRDLAAGQKEEPWSQFDPVPYLSEYGPGSVDYLEWRDQRQVGPLISPKDLMFRAGEKSSPFDIENSLRDTPKAPPVWNTRIPGIPNRPEYFNPIHPTRRIVEADTGTVNDASPPQALKRNEKGELAPTQATQLPPLPPKDNGPASMPPPDMLDKAFLLGAQFFDALGLSDPNTELYTDVVARGNKQPITEERLRPESVDMLRNVVDTKRAKTPGPQGTITSEDYSAAGYDDKGLLGLFDYDIDDEGNITARDTYDFNLSDVRSDADQVGLGERLKLMFSDPTAYAGYVGTKAVPDLPGQGVPVNINLGNTMAEKKAQTKPQQTATPSVAGTKGPAVPDSSDPLSMMASALFDLFRGGTPSPGMGGGETVAPKGFSPYTQQPSQADVPIRNPFFTAGPEESFPSFLFEGPGLAYPKSTPGPMEVQARKAQAPQPQPQPQAPTGGPVPVPTANPAFHDSGTDARDFGYMLYQMFGGDQGIGAVPPRNPLFTGGV